MKSLTVLLLTFLYFTVCAQTDYRPDYIILNSGKKIEGQITYVGDDFLYMEREDWREYKKIPFSNLNNYQVYGMIHPHNYMALPLSLDEKGTITFSEVIQVPDVRQDDLYRAGLDWYVKYFDAVDEVLETRDGNTEMLTGRIVENIFIGGGLYREKIDLSCTVKMYFKEGRYKYEITDLYFARSPEVRNLHYACPSGGQSVAPARFAAELMLIEDFYDVYGNMRRTNGRYKVETLKKIEELTENIKMTLAQAGGEEEW